MVAHSGVGIDSQSYEFLEKFASQNVFREGESDVLVVVTLGSPKRFSLTSSICQRTSSSILHRLGISSTFFRGGLHWLILSLESLPCWGGTELWRFWEFQSVMIWAQNCSLDYSNAFSCSEGIFSVEDHRLTVPSGILAIESCMVALEIYLNLSRFHLDFHFSDHLEGWTSSSGVGWASMVTPMGGGRWVFDIQLAFNSNVVGDGNRFSAGSHPIVSGNLLLWRHFG